MLWNISWANLTMLLATIPSYDSDEEKETKGKEVEGIDELAGLMGL